MLANLGKDIVCVQDIDSVLSFYENESFSFSYNWNKEPIKKFPLEIAYIPNRDLIIIVNNLYTIECYRYQQLAMDHMNGKSDEARSKDQKKKLVPEWTYSFGEFVLDVQTVLLDKWFIVVLGERNLCVLRENGTFWFVKKFDINPSCVCAFANDNRDTLITVIGTQICNLLIYQNDVLKWASKIPFIPISIRRANLTDISGAIVLLSEKGNLSVGYLGTNPSLKLINIPVINDTTSIDKISQELKEFKKMLNFENSKTINQENKFSNTLAVEVIEIKLKDTIGKSIQITLRMTSNQIVKRVKFMFRENDFYEITPRQQEVTNLEGPVTLIFVVQVKHNTPLDMVIKYCIMFIEDNICRTLTKSIALPFEIFINMEPSLKNCKYIIKLLLEKPFEEKESLASLFEDIVTPSATSIIFSFKLQSQIHVGIKQGTEDSCFYQIESNDLYGIFIACMQIKKRTKSKSIQNPVSSVVVNFQPVESLCTSIESRVARKNILLDHKKRLGKFTQHFRVLQKRILVKIKDKNPSSLENMEKLLNVIHSKVIRIKNSITKLFLRINNHR